MIRFKLSTKVLIYFLIVSLVPITVATFILVSSANTQLLNAASAKQQAIANDLSDRVSNYLNDKTRLLVEQSRIYSGHNISSSDTSIDTAQSLAVLFSQDSALDKVSVLNGSGKEQIAFDRNGQLSKLSDDSGSTAFQALTVDLHGGNYVSSVNYNSQGEPLITIAVPILSSNYSQHLNDLSKASFGKYNNPNDIQGAIVANYNVKDLWQSVLSTKIGNGGYAYVVDSLEHLVAYPKFQFLEKHPKLSNVQAVSEFQSGKFATMQTISETGQKVVSTPRLIPNFIGGWGVIVEEPVSSIYASVNSFIKQSVIVGVSAIILSVFVIFFFRKQLVEPIKKLSAGAKRLGEGQFDKPIELKSHDELQELADTFNKMGISIQSLVGDLKTNNSNLLIEQMKLNNIISSVSDGIIAVNHAGKIVLVNPPAAKLIGLKPSDLLGKDMSTMFAWEHGNTKFMPEIKKPGSYHYTDLILQHNNNLMYLDLMVSVLDANDNQISAIITVHDQTQSRELDFMKLDFVAIAAHELRTPLTVVRGYLDILNNEAIKQLSIFNLENLQKAIVGTEQLRNLINKLLNIARIERGEMEIFIEKLDLTSLVQTSVDQHETTAIQKEQRITYSSDSKRHIIVPADSSSIVEVLNNLIGNALKFTEPGGTIKVNLSANTLEARVEVTDNGPGVPEELRARLFTKFYRAERSLIAGSRGTGLGLFISKTIIELQHGKIGIAPSTGKGSTFYFTLPIYDPAKHDKLVSKQKRRGGIHGWFKKRPTSRG